MTWYRHALGYRVDAELRPAGTQALAFRREDGALLIDLGELAEATVERIEVGWPARRLAELTLIDTPGLGSADTGSSARTTEALLDEDGDRPGEADAVIYLMRHLHRYDAQFLEAFIDRTLAHASPINAIVVLSRADEIGAARPDALDSARTVAARYAADRRIRELASAVVPVAGLIAETGATLREQQVTWLRAIAALDDERRAALLRSVDRFRDADLNPLGGDIREELLDRLGLFGIRLCVGLLAGSTVRTATELSQRLLAESGIGRLQRDARRPVRRPLGRPPRAVGVDRAAGDRRRAPPARDGRCRGARLGHRTGRGRLRAAGAPPAAPPRPGRSRSRSIPTNAPRSIGWSVRPRQASERASPPTRRTTRSGRRRWPGSSAGDCGPPTR